MVLSDQRRQRTDGIVFALFGEGGVDHRGVQHLAGPVHHRDLAAVAVAGVKAHGDLALDGRLHEQGLEVQTEHLDSALVCRIGEAVSRLALHGGEDEAVIGVVCRGSDKGHGGGAGADHRAAHMLEGKVPVKLDRYFQKALFFPAIDGEDLVPLQAGDGGVEIVIQTVDGVFLRGSLAVQGTAPGNQIAQYGADTGVVRDVLGDDVGGACQRVLHGFDAFFGIDILLRQHLGRGAVGLLGKELVGQRFQALFLRHGGAGAALGLIGAV